MNKCVLFLLLCQPFFTFGQSDSTRRISKNYVPAVTSTYLVPLDTLIELKLVELALTSPGVKSSSSVNKLNELEIKRAKTQWLNLLTISTSYYPSTFQDNNPAAPIVYPKYYFGVTIPLGIIFSQPISVKSAREGLVLSTNREEEFIRNIIVEIVGKYRQYKLLDIEISMQREIINDVLVNANQLELDFKKGLIKVEDFIASQKIKNEELLKVYDLELRRDVVRLDIEKIIGVPLEDVIKSVKQ